MKETLQIPTPETLEALIGKELYDIWTSLCQLIEQSYYKKVKCGRIW